MILKEDPIVPICFLLSDLSEIYSKQKKKLIQLLSRQVMECQTPGYVQSQYFLTVSQCKNYKNVENVFAHQVESDHCDFWSPPVLKTGRGTSRARTCTAVSDSLGTKDTERGARTLDHQVKSLTLYRLS